MAASADVEMLVMEEGRSPSGTRREPHPTEEVDPVPNSDFFSRFYIGVVYFLITITAPISIWFCFFTVQEYQRGVWLRLGRLRRSVGPGFYVKFPWIDEVILVDMRVRTLNVVPQSVSFLRLRLL